MQLVTYDCGLRNQLPLTWLYTWLSGPSPAARFLEAITASSRPPQVPLQPTAGVRCSWCLLHTAYLPWPA